MTYSLKKCMLAAVMCLFTLHVAAEEEIIVYEKGKSEPVFNCWLAEKPVITFGQNSITLKVSDLEATLPIANVERVEFKFNETDVLTDIEDVEQREETVPSFRYIDGQTIEVAGVADDASVLLYSIDGKAAPLSLSRNGSRITVGIRNLQKGIYILRVDKQTYKIFKK